jgi:hypothetical protein
MRAAMSFITARRDVLRTTGLASSEELRGAPASRPGRQLAGERVEVPSSTPIMKIAFA